MMSPSNLPAPPAAGTARPEIVPAATVPAHRGTVAFMSSVIRNGDWELPRVFRVAAAMGNVELDLTGCGSGPGRRGSRSGV